MRKSLTVKDINILFFALKEEVFISLIDIARYKNSDDSRFVVQNWMKTGSAVEFLRLWEMINNPDFNRIGFDTFKNKSGSNTFVLYRFCLKFHGSVRRDTDKHGSFGLPGAS